MLNLLQEVPAPLSNLFNHEECFMVNELLIVMSHHEPCGPRRQCHLIVTICTLINHPLYDSVFAPLFNSQLTFHSEQGKA
jgi:hypothetical protein